MEMWCHVVVVVLAVVMGTELCAGQKPFLGGCPIQSVVQNFDTSQYLGKWYEIKKYFTVFELGGRCITATYSDKGDGKIGIVNQQTNPLTNTLSTTTGEAVLVNPYSKEAKLTITFGANPFGGLGVGGSGNYWVLETDYINYSLVWSCQDLVFVNLQYLWILTREKSPSSDLISMVNEKIRARNLNVDKLEKTNQSNCP